MNTMEETRGVYRVEFVGMSIREIKDVLEDKWGVMVWSGGNAFPGGDIQLKMLNAPNKAAADVVAERQRQITVEGWTPEHDDEHTYGELVQEAADLCVYGTDFRVVDLDGDRMVGWGLTEAHRDNRRRQLVIAGALILAEIERIDRVAAKGKAA